MRASTRWITGLASVTLIALAPLASHGQQGNGSGQPSSGEQRATGETGETNKLDSLETQAQQALQTFKVKDPSLETFFTNSAGYAVFPNVGEGALIVGGAHGKGIVYQNGQAVGEATVTKGTVGAQVGGQSFAELIFFQTPRSLLKFKKGSLDFSAGVNAVAANAGVGKTTDYRNEVAVFTTSRSGLMAKAAIGGQKFTFQPLAMGGGGLGGQSGASSGSSSNGFNPVGGSRQ